MRITKLAPLFVTASAALGCIACQNESMEHAVPVAAPPFPEQQFHMVASVQELMHDMVDPAADAVWDTVGTTITAKGIEDRQPITEAEWREVKGHTVSLIEATNLLAMQGRRLVPAGSQVLDEGNEGVLTAEAGQKLLDAQHETFAKLAYALGDAGQHMLVAIEAKDPKTMLEVGTEMDGICESCHTIFWYPNQVYPSSKNGFTTLDAQQSAKKN
jgi:hypothetical protein